MVIYVITYNIFTHCSPIRVRGDNTNFILNLDGSSDVMWGIGYYAFDPMPIVEGYVPK